MTRGHRAPDGMTRGRAMRRAAGANRAGRERPPGGARRPASSAPTARARGRSKQRARDPQAAGAAPDSDLDAFFLRVRLEDTGEVFRVANCRGDMTVRELREDLELIVGIPFNLQRLQYLDQGVMRDDSTLRFYDVVPGGVLSLCVWHYDDWTELVLAAVEGDPSKLASLGIAEDSFYRTANSRYFEGEMWRQWISERAFVALYIASHRGHCDTVQYLLEQGASCQDSTPLGRTPLHAAVAMGRLGCMNLLLKHGAPIHEKDFKGETPISIARGLSRKQTERHMFLLHTLVKLGKKDAKDLDMKEVFPGVSAGSRSKKPAG